MVLTFRMPSPQTRKVIKLLIKILISVLCIWYVAHKIDLKKTAGILSIARVEWVVLAALAFIVSKILSAFRLNIYFRNIGIRLPEWKNIQLYWLGMFYNLFLPGSISGDAYKVIRLAKECEVPYKKTTAAVLLDRFSGLLALELLLGVFWFISFKGGYYSISVIVSILLTLPFFYMLVKIFFPYFIPGFLPTFAWGLAVQVLQMACMYCALLALRIHDHLPQYMLIFLISSVVAVLPFTIGGLGAREVVFLWGAHVFGLDNTISVTASALFYSAYVIASLPGLPFIFFDPLKKTGSAPVSNAYAAIAE